MPKAVSILGSTGSIGENALDVVRRLPGRLRVVALSAATSTAKLLEQAWEFRPELVAVADEQAAGAIAGELPPGTRLAAGEEGLVEAAAHPAAAAVLVAIVGRAGLVPTVAALKAGKKVALASKEPVVMAGALLLGLASEGQLIPVDSEPNAIFQCLGGRPPSEIAKIYLTASGGPFYGRHARELARVTAEEALRHPVWKMGPKITIDSATLMNKGLEVIEAHHLFGVPYDRIEVLVHPGSRCHSLVELTDGTILAAIGVPDMRVPIQHALLYPERVDSGLPRLSLADGPPFEFHPPDLANFPCLELAYEAGRTGGTMPAVLSAADDVAVCAFRSGRIGFLDIPLLVRSVMDLHEPRPLEAFEDALEADAWAREAAQGLLAAAAGA